MRLGWRFATLESESDPDGDGWITVVVRADSEDVAVECALSLAGQAEVLEPAELRERVRALARALLSQVDDQSPGEWAATEPAGSSDAVVGRATATPCE